ncbi:hypothetical protein GQ42DRAFT_164014 [Ramicandelaber brevisporus]|nr:hypothetical protein GQ42DRAFT_164014 [Ramicandelaber brevisporus]
MHSSAQLTLSLSLSLSKACEVSDADLPKTPRTALAPLLLQGDVESPDRSPPLARKELLQEAAIAAVCASHCICLLATVLTVEISKQPA